MDGLPSMTTATARRSLRPALLALVLLLVAGCTTSIDSRLEEIRALQDAGQFSESIEPLRSILAEAPDLPEANHRLGVALVQTGQASLAVWPLEKSAASGEYAVTSGLLLSTAFMAINAQDDAIRVASRVLEADPERAAALRIRAQAHLAAGHPAEALADARRLAQMLPDDYQAAVLLGSILASQGQLVEAEQVFTRVVELGEKSGDPALAARGCLALANFFDKGKRDKERAEQAYAECVASHPTEPLALQLATQFYDATNRSDRATALWQSAVAEAPENLSFRMMLAERMAAAGQVDEGEALLMKAAESFGTQGAWQVLSDFQRRHGRRDEAARSLERAMEASGGGDDTLRFAQGDLYVDLGRLDDAEKIAAAITEPTYRELLRGKILLAKGDPKGALAAFDAGIRRWPNNAVARYLAGLAAYNAGEPERAMSELREAVRADPAASDASLLLASLHFERGEWPAAVQAASTHVSKRDPSSAQAFSIAIRAATAAKQYDTARATLENLRRVKGAETLALMERAGIERAVKGPAASLAVLEGANLDLTNPANEAVLRAVVEDLLVMNAADRAVARVDAALSAHPESGSLAELRAAVLARTGKTAEARAAFEKAIAADPQSPRPLVGLATLEAAAGNASRAVELLDRAAPLGAPNDPARYLAAQLLIAQGKTADAEARLREVIEKSPTNNAARNDLAWLLASRGADLDTALSLAEQARRANATADVIDTLGFVKLKRGEATDAVPLFEEALTLRPKDPTIRYHLGLALLQAGDRERARDELRRAIENGPFADAEAARQELARLQQPQG